MQGPELSFAKPMPPRWELMSEIRRFLSRTFEARTSITGMRPRTFLAVSLLASLTLAPQCATRPTPEAAAPPLAEAPEPAPSPSAEAADPFGATVRPILLSNCAPCHEPGGKMYARLPFDDSKTVASHSEGILRRLKGDDRAALEKWLAGLAPAAGVR